MSVVRMVGVSISMSVLSAGIDADKVDFGKSDTALGFDGVRKRAYRCNRPFEDGRFKTRRVIEVNVRSGDDDVVMIVLQIHQPLREGPGVMIVHVGKAGDTLACFGVGQTAVLNGFAHEVANRF